MHAFLERFEAGRWEHVPGTPFSSSHALFSWLGGVRRGIAPHITSIAAERGLPADVSWPVTAAYGTLQESAFAESWVSLQELLDFDYDDVVTALRPIYADGAKDQAPLYYHELLGEAYMADLAKLNRISPGRVVFWF